MRSNPANHEGSMTEGNGTSKSRKRSKKRLSLNGFRMKTGSKSQVLHGIAEATVGGIKKEGLIKNKYGRIVFKNKAEAARKNQNLVKAGYSHRKDHIFGAVYNGVPIPITIKKKKL